MHYSHYVRLNLPIASGVVEASCKTLVTQRLKQSGMFWSDPGAQAKVALRGRAACSRGWAILTLRSLIQSNRWKSGWDLLRKSYLVSITILA